MDDSKKIADMFNKYADTYQDKYMDVSLYANTLNIFCETIKIKNARILDIACGPGNTSQYLLRQKTDFQILGIDLSPNMVELAKKNNPTAECRVMDGTAINTLAKKFDGIIAGFYLPYISKEAAIDFIHSSSELLNAKGLLYISTMEGNYSDSDYVASSSEKEDRLMTFYHQADYLIEALIDNGFKMIHLQRVENMDSMTTDLCIVAQKSI